MSDLEIKGLRGNVFVRKWAPAGPPRFTVLLVHGYGEHAGRYEHVAAALTAAGAVVYAPDHHGHGRSDGERAVVDDIDAMAADVGRVADVAHREHGDLPLAVVGHSLGGMIATRFVQSRHSKVDALVLSAPAFGASPELLGLRDMDPIPEIPLDPTALSRDPEVGKAYAADPLVFHGPFHGKTLREMHAAIERITGAGSFGSLPTLWIHGDGDPLVPYPLTKKVFQPLRGTAFEAKVYAGAMHEVFNETNRDEVLGDVVSFLQRALSLHTGS